MCNGGHPSCICLVYTIRFPSSRIPSLLFCHPVSTLTLSLLPVKADFIHTALERLDRTSSFVVRVAHQPTCPSTRSRLPGVAWLTLFGLPRKAGQTPPLGAPPSLHFLPLQLRSILPLLNHHMSGLSPAPGVCSRKNYLQKGTLLSYHPHSLDSTPCPYAVIVRKFRFPFVQIHCIPLLITSLNIIIHCHMTNHG